MASLSGRRSGTDEQRVVMLDMAKLKEAAVAMEARQASTLVMEAPVIAVMLILAIRRWVVSVGVAQSNQDLLHLNFSYRTFPQRKSKQMGYTCIYEVTYLPFTIENRAADLSSVKVFLIPLV